MEAQTDALGGYVFVVLLILVPVWRICRRLGMNPALSLLMFLPLIGIPLLAWILAFSSWPNATRAP
jgi:hypothetical protein